MKMHPAKPGVFYQNGGTFPCGVSLKDLKSSFDDTPHFCYENVALKRAQNASRLSAGRLCYEIVRLGRAWYGISSVIR